MAKFAFRPEPPTKQQLQSELRGHNLAKEGVHPNRLRAYDPDAYRNPDVMSGFDKERSLQKAEYRMNKRNEKPGYKNDPVTYKYSRPPLD